MKPWGTLSTIFLLLLLLVVGAIFFGIRGAVLAGKGMQSWMAAEGLMMVVGACTVFIWADILRRLANIRKAVEKIRDGNLDVAVPVAGNDELGALADSFNRMVADLRQSREEVVAARNYLDNIIHSMVESLIVVGADGLIRSVNAATCTMLGYEEEPVGQPYSRILADPPFAELREKGLIRDTEKTYVTQSGRGIPVAFSGAVMWDDKGAAAGYVCLAFDITELKKVEEQLRDSHEFSRTVLNSMNDAVSIIDARTFAITGVNAAFLKASEAVEEHVVGRSCHDLSGSCSDLCKMLDDECPIRRTIKTGQSAAAEHMCYDNDGRRRFVELSTSPIRDRQGEVQQIVQVSRDITQRKHDEEELQRYSEELRKSNEDLRDFAYIVSHDLRAPLVNIKGFSAELSGIMEELDVRVGRVLDLLDEREREAITILLRDEVPEALGFIDSSVKRMNKLINGVLALSRMGLQKLRPGPVRVDDLVEGILRSLRHQLDLAQATVAVGPLPEIVVDRTALEQILGNLIDNAIKYLDPSRPGRLEIDAEAAPGETIFHVRDNGRGLAPEETGKIFDIFRRAGAQDVPGDGLGLAFVKTLIRRLGGRIWCQSEQGVGTTFSFALPLARNLNEETT